MQVSLLDADADTQILGEGSTQIIDIEAMQREEKQRRLQTRRLEIESYAAMSKDRVWEALLQNSDIPWKEYESAIDLCEDPKQKFYLSKLIRGMRSRHEEARIISLAISG